MPRCSIPLLALLFLRLLSGQVVSHQVESKAGTWRTWILSLPTVTIGGISATVAFAGLSSSGLYQVNVRVPVSTPDGDAVVRAQSSSFCSQANAIVAVKRP